ncbi:hypothetical protein SYNPS1DRAFT_32001 [Syncephalis pseudoplumigaleata]|uniref:Alpha/beta hydrolase fold-3 domain-containing protein n=1 Tax=Syncephalis pseudoplumigaleata TaxID=1712513 RepID=A0A4P9YU82_9FUNG|nr:hypothetical protein SYNPS1DRAFT_32001 [Syncephalis pseudoplumigaleata]|eukprot:RKP22410.1 hypothetical protein SYNPS1DRAFT_32001 [Syncephalis pseudoplumigaleata]
MDIMRVLPFGDREHFYVKSHDLIRHPYVSPFYATYEHFPPMLVQTGTAERLYDEGKRCAKSHRVANAGRHTPTRLEIYEEMPHVWQALTFLPSAKEALRRTSLFIVDVWQHASNNSDNNAANNTATALKDWYLKIDTHGKATTLPW